MHGGWWGNVADARLPEAPRSASGPGRGRLSGAELSIVESVLQGATNCEIARERGSSARTVAHQIAAVYRKLGVSSRGELAARLLPGAEHAASMNHGLHALTSREREVVAYAALGHSNKVIAYELGLAESAVAMRLSRAAKKLGVRRRVELIRAVVESGRAPVSRAGSASR